MIQGKQKENNFEQKAIKVGLGEVKVVGINPSADEYKEITGNDLKEGSKGAEYVGESKDNNTTLRIDIWVENIKSGDRDKITYFLENKPRENKDGTKKQYINNIGSCSWADEEENLPEWFKKREYRQAYQGEEDLYNFMKIWLSKLDYKDAETVLQLEWKKLMKGNLKDLKDQIGGEFSSTFVVLYTVRTVEKDGETKEYQSIYGKCLLPTYALKNFRLVDYSKEDVQNALRAKKSKDLKIHEKFVVQITDPEHGCKDFYSLKDVKEYDPSENFVASDKVLSEDDSSY